VRPAAAAYCERKAEGREDRARLLERYGAAAVVLQQGRSVEARQDDAEAPSRVTSPSTSGAGPPAAKTARVIRASHSLSAAARRA